LAELASIGGLAGGGALGRVGLGRGALRVRRGAFWFRARRRRTGFGRTPARCGRGARGLARGGCTARDARRGWRGVAGGVGGGVRAAPRGGVAWAVVMLAAVPTDRERPHPVARRRGVRLRLLDLVGASAAEAVQLREAVRLEFGEREDVVVRDRLGPRQQERRDGGACRATRLEPAVRVRVPHLELDDAVAVEVEEVLARRAAVVEHEEPAAGGRGPDRGQQLDGFFRLAAEAAPA